MQEYKSFYKKAGGEEGSRCKYATRLDTYGCGCSHDCKYCYAKSLLSFRNLWHPELPSVASIEKIRKKIKWIKKHQPGLQVIRLGGMTDCFQPIEMWHHVTYETIKALNEAGLEYLIVTKSDRVASDEYIEILDKKLAHIQITVTTTDDDLSLTYEKAVVPSRRIAAIEKLDALGFDVALRLSPFIPEYVDLQKLGAVKCKKMQVEFLRVNSWIEKWFDIDYSRYTVKSGGYRHLPLETKKSLLYDLHSACQHNQVISVCEDEPEAYLYWVNHFNPNRSDCCNLRRETQ